MLLSKAILQGLNIAQTQTKTIAVKSRLEIFKLCYKEDLLLFGS